MTRPKSKALGKPHKKQQRQRLTNEQQQLLVRAIRDLILQKKLAGPIITAEEVVGTLEIVEGKTYAKSNVRVAFVNLEYEGLLRILPAVGAELYVPTLEEVGTILDLRKILEAGVAARVCEYADTAKRLNPLTTINQRMHEAVEKAEVTEAEFRENDTEFHTALFHSADRSKGIHLLTWCRQMLVLLLGKNYKEQSSRKEVCEEHDQILNAVQFKLGDEPRPKTESQKTFHRLVEKLVRRIRIEKAFDNHLSNSLKRSTSLDGRECQLETPEERTLLEMLRLCCEA